MKFTKKNQYQTIGIVIFLFVLTSLGAQNANSSNLVFEIKTIETQKAIVIKSEVPSSEVGSKMGEIYKKIYAYAAENKIMPAGPPFSVYYSYEPNGKTVFEAGIPVIKQVSTSGEILFKEYPPMKVLKTTYVGEYEKMAPVYEKITQYIKDQKLESLNICWEVYLTDPSTLKNPADNKTLIYFTIK
jgi:effector-binding domain-containing protein